MSLGTQKFESEKRETQLELSLAEGEKSLKKKQEPVNFEAFERQVHTLVKSSKDRLKDLPKSFQDSLHDNLVQYLRTSVERYDTDAEVGLSKDEFEKYKRDMLQKVGETIARYTPSAENLEGKKQQKEGTVEAAKVAQKSAAIEIKETNFNEADLQTPQGVQQELAKFNMQSADVHKKIGALSVNIGDFQQAFQRFEKGKNDWGVFLRGSPFVDDSETEQLRTQLSTLKRTLDEKMRRLQDKKRTLLEYGQKLNGAGDTMKRQKIDERDGKFREIDAQDTQTEQAQKKNETQYRALEAQQQKLYGQRDAMADYHDDLVQGLVGISTSREQVQVHSDQFGEFNGQLEDAVAVIDDALANTPPSPQRDQLEAKKTELLGHKKNVDAAIFQTQGTEMELDFAEQFLQGKRGEAEATSLTLDAYLTKTVVPSMEALFGSIQALEIAKLKNGTQREQMEAQYAEILQTIDNVDATVADNVLENNLANEQAIASLVTQKQSLDAISVDRPNLWNATGGLLVGKIGEGLSLPTKDVVCGILLDPASAWLKEVTKDIPLLNVITEVGANVIIDFPSGVIEGAGELVNGVATMIAHPVDAIVGIGTLIGRNPQTGEWSLLSAGNAWHEMGKALIAYENFEKGEVGKGVGKVTLNVLLTATGIGAGAKGVQAASIAYSVARASGAGVARASLRAAGTGARLFAGEFSHGVARLPGEALSATGKLLRAPGKLLENMKLGTAGRLGKEISEMGDELAKASKGLEDFTIGGKKVSELEAIGGKNSRELAELSPDDLAKVGIKDSGAIREFLEYKNMLKKVEKIEASKVALVERLEKVKTQQAFLEYQQMTVKKDFDGIKSKEAADPSWKARVERAKKLEKEGPAIQEVMSHIQRELKDAPELVEILRKYLEDVDHPMNISAYLKNPLRRDAVLEHLKAISKEKNITEAEFLNIVGSTHDASRAIFRTDDVEFTYLEGRKKAEILSERILAENPELFSLGDTPTVTQQLLLQRHAERLATVILPKFRSQLEAIVAPIKQKGFPPVNARAKSAEGMVDKIKRMRRGNGGKAPRPDYMLKDMPDAVGGRITIRDPAQMERIMQKIEETFGKENIFEKDSFYSNPKKKNAPYRVITYTITVDGVPCELQLTTLDSSLVADLYHNVVYKELLPTTSAEKRHVANMQRKATAKELKSL